MFETLTDTEILAKLIYGEAANEPIDGQIAVAWVVRHRVYQPRWWGRNWREVMLKPYQFSCFNNRERALNIPIMPMKLWIAEGVVKGYLPDYSKDATHYHAIYIEPEWAVDMQVTAEIGNHIFYKGRF